MEENYGDEFIERRRPTPVKLDDTQSKMLEEIHFVLMDKEVGVRTILKQHHETLYGNGKVGMTTKLIVMQMVLFLVAIVVGAEHPIIRKILSRWG